MEKICDETSKVFGKESLDYVQESLEVLGRNPRKYFGGYLKEMLEGFLRGIPESQKQLRKKNLGKVPGEYFGRISG